MPGLPGVGAALVPGGVLSGTTAHRPAKSGCCAVAIGAAIPRAASATTHIAPESSRGRRRIAFTSLRITIAKRTNAATVPHVLELQAKAVRIGQVQLLGVPAHLDRRIDSLGSEFPLDGIRVESIQTEADVIDPRLLAGVQRVHSEKARTHREIGSRRLLRQNRHPEQALIERLGSLDVADVHRHVIELPCNANRWCRARWSMWERERGERTYQLPSRQLAIVIVVEESLETLECRHGHVCACAERAGTPGWPVTTYDPFPARASRVPTRARLPRPPSTDTAPQLGGLLHHLIANSLASSKTAVERRAPYPAVRSPRPCDHMKRLVVTALALAACRPNQPEERYGFVARLGRDTVSVESVRRRGNHVTSDEVDRFPLVRQRHTEIDLLPNGGIRHLVMDIVTPSEAENQRNRRVTVDVTKDSVHITKRDSAGTVRRDFATRGGVAMAHLPQMYSLYELYFAAALGRMASATSRDTARLRQFYIDREFDNFPLHRGFVMLKPDHKAEIRHDWLSGIGEATLDSANRLISYSGARTTYKVDVERLSVLPDVKSIGDRFAAMETASGGFKSLSVRDTARGKIGNAIFAVDYGRPLMRGRVLLGNVIQYDRVWRTGANAATQFSTSAPITIAGLNVPAGTYTLWTVPHTSGVELIVNKETGQWGTGYNGTLNLGKVPMQAETVTVPVDKFTISIVPSDARHGSLVMEWGTFKWIAPIAETRN